MTHAEKTSEIAAYDRLNLAEAFVAAFTEAAEQYMLYRETAHYDRSQITPKVWDEEIAKEADRRLQARTVAMTQQEVIDYALAEVRRDLRDPALYSLSGLPMPMQKDTGDREAFAFAHYSDNHQRLKVPFVTTWDASKEQVMADAYDAVEGLHIFQTNTEFGLVQVAHPRIGDIYTAGRVRRDGK